MSDNEDAEARIRALQDGFADRYAGALDDENPVTPTRDDAEDSARPDLSTRAEARPLDDLSRPERAAAPEPAPVTEAVRPAAPETRTAMDPSEIRIKEARDRFLQSKKRLAETNNLMSKIKRVITGDETDATLKTEYDRAEAEYKRARAEYVGEDLTKYLAEHNAMLEANLEQHRSERHKGQQAYDWYKGLAQYNLGDYLADKGMISSDSKSRKVLRLVNPRTATSAILLGTGLAVGGWAGVGILATKRIYGSVATGVGTYDMMNYFGQKFDRKFIDKDLSIAGITLGRVQDYIASIEANGLLDGKKIEDLRQDELYMNLRRKEASLMVFEPGHPGYLNDRLNHADYLLDQNLKSSTKSRRKNMAVASVAAAIVGSGALAKVVKWNFGPKAADVPATPDQAPQPAIKTSMDFIKPKTGVPDMGSFSDEVKIRDLRPDSVPPTIEDVVDVKTGAPDVSKIGQAMDINKLNQPGGGSAELIKPKMAVFDSGKPSADVGDIPVKQPGYVPKTGFPDTTKIGKSINIEDLKPKGAGAAAEATTGKTETVSTEMRSGAKMEVKGAEAILHAGGRGVEGAMIDLQKANPAKYAQMMEWMRGQYPGFSGKDSNLIHKFVTDYAGKNGMTVDGGGKDLSRILSADMKIGANGEVTFGDVDFMKETSVATSAAAESAGASEVSEAALAEEQAGDIETQTYEHPKESLGIKASVVDFKSPAVANNEEFGKWLESSERIVAETDTKVIETHRFEAALSVPKTSTGLELVLGDEKDQFVKKVLGTSDKKLNDIGKLSVSEFVNKYKSDRFFSRGLGKLFKHTDWEGLAKTNPKDSVKNILIALAKYRTMELKQAA